MLNNAIDHSKSKRVMVVMTRKSDLIIFSITDEGVGIFNIIKSKFKLADTMSAIQELLKGKQTTDPNRHSGEGVFFTSKMADTMSIASYEKVIFFYNKIDDFSVYNRHPFFKGTRILFQIDLDSKAIAKDIFDEYADVDEGFTKTRIRVKLFKIKRNLISRSEAKRIMHGLDKFEEVVLDFKGVETVGQGFSDEIFRVWSGKYPNIKIIHENTNENVDFMLKRV